MFFVGSCGFGGSQSSSTGGANARSGTMQTDIGIDELRELARPPEMGGSSVETPGVRTGSGDFRDINQQPLLFEESIRNTGDRLDRLENAVQDLSNDFNELSPAIKRLVEIESDLRELHDQLSMLINGPTDEMGDDEFMVVAPEVSADPAPARVAQMEPIIDEPTPDPEPAAAKPTPIVPVSSNLPNIRAADHSGKTRIVFETANKTQFSQNFDADNQLLVISSPVSFSNSILNGLARSSKNIVDVTSTASGEGVDVAIMTKGISNVGAHAYIGPTNSNKNHRYYIDIEQ